MRLTDSQIRDVLARAEEIGSAYSPTSAMSADMEAVIEAGEAVGIPRTAIEKALREELNLLARPAAAGDLVFVKSADDKYYVANVVSSNGDEARVRFLRGGEHTVTPDQIRPCAFLPGEKVMVNWPWWGPWTCSVVRYDAEQQKVTVDDGGGYVKTFPIAEVWLAKEKTHASRSSGSRAKVYLMIASAGLGAGGLIGSLITWLLLR